jgi:hypothetical protein
LNKEAESAGNYSRQGQLLAPTYLLISEALKAVEIKDVETAQDKLTEARISLKSVKSSVVRVPSSNRRLH